MAEAHLDHPGDWRWYGARPAPVIGLCPHDACPHNQTRGIADGPDFEHYVLDECQVPADEGGCGGTCRGWFSEWPPGEGPGGVTYRPPLVWSHVDLQAVG